MTKDKMKKLVNRTFNLNKTKDIKEILNISKKSLVALAHIFFREHLQEKGRYVPPSDVHFEMSDLLINSYYEKYNPLLILPRSMAKSTYMDIFFMVWLLLFSNKSYIVLVGDSDESIKKHFSALKDEIKHNKLLDFFGIRYYSDGLNNSNQIDVEATLVSGAKEGKKNKRIVRIECYGASGFPRGLKNGSQRPDYILIDDLERKKQGTKTGVESKAYRDSIESIFYASIVFSAFNTESMQIAISGTIMHPDQLLVKLYNMSISGEPTEPRFKSIKKSFIENFGEENERSIWPEKMSLETFYNMLNTARKNGTEHIVYNELLSLDKSPDVIIFKRSMFNYFFKRANKLYLCDRLGGIIDKQGVSMNNITRMITIDVAFTIGIKSDDTSIAVSGVDKDDNIYVLKLDAGKFAPSEIAERTIKDAKLFNVEIIGVETANGGNIIMDSIQKECEKNGLNIEIVPLKTGNVKKHIRIISSLEPYYTNSKIFHNIDDENLDKLEEQIIGITKDGIKTKHDDLVDSVSYAPTIINYNSIDNFGTNNYITSEQNLINNLDNLKNNYIF